MGHFIVVLLLAALVVLASMYMIAKTKKDQLGKGFLIVSYVMAGFGVLVFVFGITAGILCCAHKGGCGKKERCEREMSCSRMEKCGGMNHCEMGGGEMRCMKMKSCGKGSCEKGGMKCGGGDEEIVIEKEIIIEKEGDEKPKIEVKVEKSPK